VVLAHNHPSGDPTPSTLDVQLTRQLSDAGRLLGVAVLDHLVIGDGGYVSFLEQGLLSSGIQPERMLRTRLLPEAPAR
jgi:DNA repair protein RadC